VACPGRVVRRAYSEVVTTILDVVDNYMTSLRAESIERMPGADLWRMHEVVCSYVDTFQPPELDSRRFPVYLGGWPSANVHDAEKSELMLSTLLYAGQIVAKDPISDWFSRARYHDLLRPMAARQGFLDDQRRPNVAGTRAFLANVVPALHRLRPLIESGVLVLVPSEGLLAENSDKVNSLRTRLLNAVGVNPEVNVGRFRPDEMPVDDRVRGLFTFAGGDREVQLRKAIERSLQFFSREWLLATTVGAEYAAPWRNEQYLCEHGLGTLLGANEHHRVINALLRSELSIFSGLTPRLVASVRDDDTFVDFRAKLFDVYRSIQGSAGDENLGRIIGQTEKTMLGPVLLRVEKAARHGFLYRAGAGLLPTAFSIGAQLLYAKTTGGLSLSDAGQVAIGELADRVPFKRTRDPLSAWTKLHRHKRTPNDDVQRIGTIPAQPVGEKPWEIDEKPSMNVRITAGKILFDDVPVGAASQPVGFAGGDYRACECNSGRKWKFCCKELASHPVPHQ
jgi:hypothetical protein